MALYIDPFWVLLVVSIVGATIIAVALAVVSYRDQEARHLILAISCVGLFLLWLFSTVQFIRLYVLGTPWAEVWK